MNPYLSPLLELWPLAVIAAVFVAAIWLTSPGRKAPHIDIRLPDVDSRIPEGALPPITQDEMASGHWPFPESEKSASGRIGIANQEPWDRWAADRARGEQPGWPILDRINQVEREMLGAQAEWMAPQHDQAQKPSENPEATQKEPSENPLGFRRGWFFVSAVGIASDRSTRTWGGFVELGGSFNGFQALLNELHAEVARNMTADVSGLPISPANVALTAFNRIEV